MRRYAKKQQGNHFRREKRQALEEANKKKQTR